MAKDYPGNARVKQLIEELQLLAERLRQLDVFEDVGPPTRKRLCDQCRELIDELVELRIRSDPVRHPGDVLNPADPRIIGKLVAAHLLRRPLQPIRDIEKFHGSGVYAIYYHGDLPHYKQIRRTHVPIYIGRSEPASAEAVTPEEQEPRLYRRLRDHVRSLENANNLNIDDFHCRYSVVVTAWEAVAESYLIRQFKPIWNKETGVLQGFGKHGDDPTTRANARSSWDTIHPGRRATRSNSPTPVKSVVDEVWKQVAQHFKDHDPKQMPTSETILNDL